MRKHLLVLPALALLLSPSLWAGQVALVVAGTYAKLSENYTTSYASSATAYDPSMGYGGGLRMSSQLGEKSFLELEALYLLRRFSTSATTYSYTYSFQTLEVPVLFRWMLEKNVSLKAGGYYAKLLGKRFTMYYPADGQGGNGSESVYNDLGYKTNDYGAVLGVAIKTSTPSAMSIDFRYTIGMANLNQGTGEADPRLKFNTFQLLLGFPLAGKP